MAQGHNHWIPVADLLSAFVVVCLLLFVSAAIKPVIEKRKEFLEAQEQGLTLEEERTERFVGLKVQLSDVEEAGVLAVDPTNRTIEFRDVSFKSGSACLSEPAQQAILLIREVVLEDLTADGSLNIYLEGHTDPVPVGGLRRACGVFENNTQLSTLRASNVRDLLLADAEHYRERMPVTGWGPDRLRNTDMPTSPVNRRVELKWSWQP
jgi:flagellar motor protein MotB